MDMTSTLQLVIETETTHNENYSKEPFLLVHVVPLVDGEPYLPEYKSTPFEALAVYGQGCKAGEVWPFNCECGTPECAGFYEPMQLAADEATVRWKFPAQPYEDLAASGPGEAKPRELIFDRAQYQAEFNRLVTGLKALEQRHGRLMIHPIPPGKFSIDETIHIARNRAEYRLMLRAALGDLDSDDVDFVVTTSNGLELTTRLSHLVYETVSPYLAGALFDLPRTRIALDELAQDLRSDAGKVLRRFDVHRLSACLRATTSTEPDDDGAEENWPVPYWTSETSPQEHLETWREIQKTAQVSVRRR